MVIPSSPATLKAVDADTSTKPGDAVSGVSSEKSRKGFARWIIFTAVGILALGAAIAGLFFIHDRATQHSKAAWSETPPVKGTAPKATPIASTVELPLDPFVVNLADAGGHSYARIGLTLQLMAVPAASAKREKKEDAAADLAGTRDMVRDTIITVLNQQQSADLLAPGGKEHLKQAIRVAVAARDSRVKIADIYFTEFLVQR